MTDLETPVMWFSQTAGGTPEPWRYFRLDGLLFNAYDILQKTIIADRMRTFKIHSYLDFRGPVMMDSGGFMFMTKKHMKVKPEAILELYEDTRPNYGVALDHPLTIGLTEGETKRRQLRTLRNTRMMVEKRAGSNPELVPVIHGHTLRSVEWFVRQLAKVGDFEIYGIGSLVPSVFNAKGVGGINNVIQIISHVRKLLPKKLIHVFGVGSTITMHLMFASGADSLDSSSWRSKAAYGIVQLPAIGDRYITGRAGKATGKKYLNLSREEVRILEQCNCPACKRLGLYGLRRSFSMRALHNCWVFQKEVEKARKLRRRNEYLSYVNEVVGKSRFSNALQLARSLKI
jgi:tRNA-guanine family transglycosylase